MENLSAFCLGDYERLVSPTDKVINGKECKIFNSVDVAENGDLYWSCSSTEFDLQNGLYDVFADGSGRYTTNKIPTSNFNANISTVLITTMRKPKKTRY